VPQPKSNTEALMQHPAEIKKSIRTASVDCVSERVETGLLMLFGSGRGGRRKS